MEILRFLAAGNVDDGKSRIISTRNIQKIKYKNSMNKFIDGNVSYTINKKVLLDTHCVSNREELFSVLLNE